MVACQIKRSSEIRKTLTLSLPPAMIIGFCKQRLSYSFSTLNINFFLINSSLINKADDKCSLKFGAERVKGERNVSCKYILD